MKAALGTPWKVLGVVPPEIRKIAREAGRKQRDFKGRFGLARLLWKGRVHEEKSVAVTLLAREARRLGPDDWAELKAWVGQVRSFDHCDGIAVELLGSLVKRDRSWCRVLKHWTLSKNPWDRRAAAGAVLLRARHMRDVEAALGICEGLMTDRAPEVRQAVEVLLGECLDADRDPTVEFLARWRKKSALDLSALRER